MLADTTIRLSEISNIVGIKEASGDLEQVKAIHAKTTSDFSIYSGDDSLTLDYLQEGAVGVVSVASHIVGKKIKKMMMDHIHHDHANAQLIHDSLKALFDVLFIETNPAPVKYAMQLLGFDTGLPRLPLLEMSEANKATLQQILDDCLGV